MITSDKTQCYTFTHVHNSLKPTLGLPYNVSVSPITQHDRK